MQYIEWAVLCLSGVGLLALCVFAWVGFRVLYGNFIQHLMAWKARRHWERFQKLPEGMRKAIDE
jgi:hypothetical protein